MIVSARITQERREKMLKKLLGTALLGAMLFAGAPAYSAQVGIGISIGAPPPPRVVHVRPAAPGSGYYWVDGYWYPIGGHYRWHRGYWTLPPYGGAAWIGPRWEGGHFYNGYWNGDRGRVEHDHRWDRTHARDRDRWHDHGHDRDHDHDHDHDHH
jgi:hypothetical protein